MLRLVPLWLGRGEMRVRVEVEGTFVFPSAGFDKRFERVRTERLRAGDTLLVDLAEYEPELLSLGGTYLFEVKPAG